jgi:hypothetical protein
MPRVFLHVLIAAAIAGLTFPAGAQAGLEPDEVQKKWARRLAGRHFRSTVHYSMPGVGDRRMTLRWDDSEKRERLLARVEWPDEIRGQSWLMLENADRPNIYVVYSTKRSSARPRQIKAITRGNPFAGADFDYLGLRVARHGHPVAKSVTSTTVGDRKALRLTEEATDMPFDRREIWLDAKTFVPLRGEYWVNDVKYLEAVTEQIDLVQGVETPTLIRFTRPAKKDRPDAVSIWKVESIDYDRPILESFFSIPK